MNFDEQIDRRGTNSNKWDDMERLFGVSSDDGIAMWVADTDFRPPDCVQKAAEAIVDHGIYGYYGDKSAYVEAACWWMQTRHNWTVAPEAVFSTHGLVNAVGLCLQTWTQPGDGVVVMSPVYHAFGRVVQGAGRKLVELPLRLDDHFEMDFDAWDAAMTGAETMLIFCTPHNPAGRVWSRAELNAVADFARRHDLILLADEVHADLVYPGHSHTAMGLIEGVADRLVVLNAASKTFNLAGAYLGQVYLPDPTMRAAFARTMKGMGISANMFGIPMTQAAYSPEGAVWADAQIAYLDHNRAVWEAGINALPGVRAVPLQATYLSWVDFTGTGMTQSEIANRIQSHARIAASPGPGFGLGGEGFMRFNLGTQHATITEALSRLHDAFGDLQ